MNHLIWFSIFSDLYSLRIIHQLVLYRAPCTESIFSLCDEINESFRFNCYKKRSFIYILFRVHYIICLGLFFVINWSPNRLVKNFSMMLFIVSDRYYILSGLISTKWEGFLFVIVDSGFMSLMIYYNLYFSFLCYVSLMLFFIIHIYGISNLFLSKYYKAQDKKNYHNDKIFILRHWTYSPKYGWEIKGNLYIVYKSIYMKYNYFSYESRRGLMENS